MNENSLFLIIQGYDFYNMSLKYNKIMVMGPYPPI